MNGAAGGPRAPPAPAPTRPMLAAGLAAFALANGAGDLSWARETRGALLDWGGPYALGARLTGPWSVVYRAGEEAGTLPTTSVVVRPGSFTVRREGPTLAVTETTVAHPSEPRLLLTRRVEFARPEAPAGEVEIGFAPFLAPVLLEGLRPKAYTVATRGPTIVAETGSFSVAIDSEPRPDRLTLNDRPWIGGRYHGPVRSLTITHRIAPSPGGPTVLRMVLTGGRRGTHPFGAVPASVDRWLEAAGTAVERWETRCPGLDLPDRPDLEASYGAARRALRTLYTAPEAGITGLVAGYPWYASLWGRDLATMLPALLWLGDWGWFESSLDTIFRFQARHRFPLLGAEAGELPMQVSPGPIFLYGTSDTSLYYPELVRRFVRHSGDLVGARRWFGALEGVRTWGTAKLAPESGLFRNGGEVAEMRDATGVAGRIHLGIDALDTTMWDSADRRDHAVELQFLWWRALTALGEFAALGEGPSAWAGAADEAARFGARLPARYRWAEESYLYDSLRRDGSPVRRLRPNALQWIGAGLLPPDEERRLVERAGREDLTTPWGLRTLAASDPDYDPTAYHEGQVWPIASAWAARAAFAVGDAERGVEELGRLGRAILEEGGFANECYRGDRAEPFNSCFLLGFSVAPFLAAFFEGLWGLEPDLPHGVLRANPRLPAGGSRMGLTGLRLGTGRLDLRTTREELAAHWSGPGPLVLVGPERSVRLTPGTVGRLPLPGAGQL